MKWNIWFGTITQIKWNRWWFPGHQLLLNPASYKLFLGFLFEKHGLRHCLKHGSTLVVHSIHYFYINLAVNSTFSHFKILVFKLQVKLIGVKLGRNLFLSNLYVKSEYQVRTVTELIEKIASTCPWIEIYSRKRKTDTKEKETSTKKAKVIIDEIDTIDYVMKKLSPIPMGNNYLGKFFMAHLW